MFDNAATMSRRHFALILGLLCTLGLLRAQPESAWRADAGFLGTAERSVTLRTSGSVTNAWYAHPDIEAGSPGILLLQPRLTSREITRQRARGLAAAGYAVLAITISDTETTDTTRRLAEPRAGFDWMHSQRQTSRQNIAVVGLGSAAGVAVRLAIVEPRLRGLVVDRSVVELDSAGAHRIAFPTATMKHPFTTSTPLPPDAAGELLTTLGEMLAGPPMPEAE